MSGPRSFHSHPSGSWGKPKRSAPVDAHSSVETWPDNSGHTKYKLLDIPDRLKPKGSLLDAIMRASDAPKGIEVFRDKPSLKVARDAGDMMHDLCNDGWRSWLPLARPPFDTCAIEVDLMMEIKGAQVEEHAKGDIQSSSSALLIFRGAMLIRDGVAVVIVDWSLGGKPPETMAAPFLLDFNSKEVEHPLLHRYVWGDTFIAKNGMPDIVHIIPSASDVITEEDLKGDRWLPASVATRPMLAALSLLNLEREHIIARPMEFEEKKWDRATKSFRRALRPHVVVIRPDAPRYVREAVARAEREATKKREHEVRRHKRRLRNGREVWVRPHKRGDASLGVVEKRYLIESDPNKGTSHEV